MSTILRFLLFPALLFFLQQGFAEPWFTGPLLAPSGKTIPLGHANLELYGFYIDNTGEFNRHWQLVHTPANQNIQFNPLFTYGLAEGVDVQASLPYTINKNQGKTGRHIGDTSVLLGFQLFKQKVIWIPDLRFTIQEIFPTGKFDDLNPTNQGTDGSGVGSYQTTLGLNFQHIYRIGATYYLRSRVVLTYLYAQPVNVTRHNAYGGNASTKGSVTPGNLMSADLAAEFSLTQHWVAVIEAYYYYRQASTFRGFPGVNAQGLPLKIGHGTIEEVTLAPAIEYNFSKNYGIIAGFWFSVAGKDTDNFTAPVVAFNASW